MAPGNNQYGSYCCNHRTAAICRRIVQIATAITNLPASAVYRCRSPKRHLVIIQSRKLNKFMFIATYTLSADPGTLETYIVNPQLILPSGVMVQGQTSGGNSLSTIESKANLYNSKTISAHLKLALTLTAVVRLSIWKTLTVSFPCSALANTLVPMRTGTQSTMICYAQKERVTSH